MEKGNINNFYRAFQDLNLSNKKQINLFFARTYLAGNL